MDTKVPCGQPAAPRTLCSNYSGRLQLCHHTGHAPSTGPLCTGSSVCNPLPPSPPGSLLHLLQTSAKCHLLREVCSDHPPKRAPGALSAPLSDFSLLPSTCHSLPPMWFLTARHLSPLLPVPCGCCNKWPLI